MFKHWFRRIHLLLAVLLAFFLINLSISGALLVFGKEIQNYAQPNNWQICEGSALLPLSRLVTLIESNSGKTVKQIQLPLQKNQAWQFKLDNGQYISVDPFNGNILHRYNEQDSFYGFIMAWHRWLLLRDNTGGKPLKVLVSIASLLFIIEMLLGLFLWLKPKKRLKRLKIKIKAKPRVRYYQLHTVVGVFTLLPLLLIALTGMAFHWQSQTKTMLEAIVAESVEQYKHPVITAGLNKTYQLDLAFNRGIQHMKPGQLYRIYLPYNNQPLKLRVKMPDETFAFSWLWIDPYTAEVIKSYDASKANLATRIWNFKYSFHTGDFFGIGLKFIWLLLALLPGIFAITGLWLFAKRTQSSKIKAI
ncbi:membrane protein [Thalassotalea insulae]|uniref:Membrane protein n=1 Tax=Thalassotalea insulae TaxID=2056778 RepID=A0ABQ6GX95_9GAMM|nr:PepSY-associated TM helix domain-containing protein [Thalassotalea insulae]GLX79939.1 membrane protein [Thalassotalea insulae]